MSSTVFQYAGLRISITYLVRIGLVLLLTLSLAVAALAAQNDTVRLEAGKPVKRELNGGQTQSYVITLTENQYLRVVAVQQGVDVVLALFGPSGKQIIEINESKSTQGTEHLSVVTVLAGSYRLEVRSAGKNAPPGTYEVRIDELRAATDEDKYRMAAIFAFTQGEALRAQGTADSLRKSLQKFKDSLLLWQALKDGRNEASTLFMLGTVYNSLGENEAALDACNKALAYWRSATDNRGLAPILSLIGQVYDALGRKSEALEKFEEALSVWQKLGSNLGAASVLNSMGALYSDIGEKQKALEKYKEAQSLWRVAQFARGEAAALNNIGGIYMSLGLPQQALENYQEAHTIWQTFKDTRGEAWIVNNIGKAYNDLGRKQEALVKYKAALELSRTAGDLAGQATALNNIGGLNQQADEKREALANYQEALSLSHSIADILREAASRNNLGTVYSDLGDQQAAADNFKKALSLWREAGDYRGQASTLANWAFMERSRGNYAEARVRIEEVLPLVETLRTKIGSPDLRSTYFATVQAYYEFYIDLLMQMHKEQPSAGHDRIALQGAERARARSLLELLAEARVDIRQGVDAKLVERERFLQQQLNAAAQKQVELPFAPYTAEKAKAITKEIKGLVADLQQVKTEIRRANSRYAALTQPEPLDLHDIQTQALDTDTLLLEYSLGLERSYLWAVTPTSITSHELPGRAHILTAAKHFNELLASRNAAGESAKQRQERLMIGESLSRMLLGPVSSQLGRKRLVIVADGPLQYLSFAALPVPAPVQRRAKNQSPLIMRHEIITLPSISIMPPLRNEVAQRAPAPQTLAVLADPVFSADDERVNKADLKDAGRPEANNVRTENSFERLGGSRKEAQRIVALVPGDKTLAALDFAARRELALSRELSSYRYVLFATHGQLNQLHPELTAIVLSLVNEDGSPQNGYLRLNEIYNLDLPADLVTLSGCETGLGKEINGEGLIGLTRGFMYAGAARVVASLWRADDEATAELMVHFYRGMLKEGKRPAAALRAAQVEMMKQAKWQSPHYWAGFMLQGEWK